MGGPDELFFGVFDLEPQHNQHPSYGSPYNEEVNMTGQQRPQGLLPTLARVSPTKVFLGALAVALLGLFLPGWYGTLLLLAVVVTLGGLLSQTWPVTPRPARVLRVLILAVLVAIATAKLVA
jgi:hypothetical protein